MFLIAIYTLRIVTPIEKLTHMAMKDIKAKPLNQASNSEVM